MKFIPLLLLILSSTAFAAPAKKVIKKKTIQTSTAAEPAPLTESSTGSNSDPSTEEVPAGTPPTTSTGTSTATTTAAPPPPPSPWRLAYSGEYYGPRLTNFDLSKTQSPLLGSTPEFTNWQHSMKVGLAIAPSVVLGAQIRGVSNFDPTAQSFLFKNHRLYAVWANMIDTADLNIVGILDAEFPSSQGAKNNGLIMAFNIKNNFTLKTQLRNWNFSFLTLIRSMFYNNPLKQSDVYLGLYPSAQWDLFADFSLLLEGSFDASHSYNDIYFSYDEADPDYLKFGFQYAFNGHVQVNPALLFYTANYSVPTIYFGLSAAL